MISIFSDQKLDPLLNDPSKSIFLAGPTPRSRNVASWRPNAIEILNKLNFDGIVLVPERSSWESRFSYLKQTEWEYLALSNAASICFWIPRDLTTLPAFTTNIEFGYWIGIKPEKVFYGRPDESPKNAYLDWLFNKITGRIPCNTLCNVLAECVGENYDN